MIINPFIGGLAIGGVGVAVTILVCNYIMRKMADSYEMRLRSRDTRIQLLLQQRDELEKAERRKALLNQIERPIGGKR